MTTEQLNEYIKHYLEEDKTKSAIMLNAPWGTGKSYYIQNELIDFLKKDDRNRCIVVSLYGMKELSEISKSIYIELRTKVLQNNSEKAETGKLVAKTVAKGITSFFGIDLSASEDDMLKLYESVNLSGKLIVLEDVERSNINILEILGYVNNLVEQDDVKVMLVANESEIIKKKPIQAETKEEEEKTESYISMGMDNRVFTNETKEYLKTKEKTISDTINFEGDYRKAIENIITSFANKTLDRFLKAESLDELVSVLSGRNLRSFIFACQKTVDIYNATPQDLDDGFIKAVFFGIVYYALQIKSGKDQNKWDGNNDISFSLGSVEYPLFRCCFEYINKHIIEPEIIMQNAVAYKELKIYGRDSSYRTDKDLQKIMNFYLYYSNEIIEAVGNVEKRLLNYEDISFYNYDRLIKNLIQLSNVIGIDISLCKERMLENLKGRGNKLNGFYLFARITDFKNIEDQTEYDAFKDRAFKLLAETGEDFLGFDYTVNTVLDFYNNTIDKESGFNSECPFAQRLDMDKLLSLLLFCSPEQIEYIRMAFINVYRSSNIKDFLAGDKPSIDYLLDKLKEIYSKETLDAIQKIQIKWFVNNLEEISAKL